MGFVKENFFKFFSKLIQLIEEAEDKWLEGKDKKEFVIDTIQGFLSNMDASIPKWLKKREAIGLMIDLIVLIINVFQKRNDNLLFSFTDIILKLIKMQKK